MALRWSLTDEVTGRKCSLHISTLTKCCPMLLLVTKQLKLCWYSRVLVYLVFNCVVIQQQKRYFSMLLNHFVRFEVFTAVGIMTFLWDVSPRTLFGRWQRFEEAHCLHLQGWKKSLKLSRWQEWTHGQKQHAETNRLIFVTFNCKRTSNPKSVAQVVARHFNACNKRPQNYQPDVICWNKQQCSLLKKQLWKQRFSIVTKDR